MPRVPSRLAFLLLLVCAVEPVRAIRQAPGVYDIRSFGARGDGKSVDSDAINKAVEAAAAAGGGIVDLPAGRYLSFSIRLKSHVTLRFRPGAVLVAGDPASGLGKYDSPEPNPSDQYQDFGHGHWRNSLISGIDVEDVAIVGPGLIDGRGLTRNGPGAPWSRANDIRIVYRGGGTAEDAKREPPEVEGAYPEPSMFGTLPPFGFYVRHAQGISMRDIVISTMTPDHRPPWLLHDARNVMLDHVEAPRHGSSPFAVLRDVADLSVRNVIGVADGRHARIPAGTLPYGQQ